MKLTVIPSDNIIILDGKPLVFQFSCPPNIHAIQWEGISGTIETIDGNQTKFVKQQIIQPYLDAFNTEVARLTQPAPLPTLAEAQTSKLLELDKLYEQAIQQPVKYLNTIFQADKESQSILTSTLVTLNATGILPIDFGWWDINNTKIVMTLAELNGLAGAMLNQGWIAFQNKQQKKDLVRSVTTFSDLEVIVW